MKKNPIIIIISLLVMILVVFLLILPAIDLLNLSRDSLAFERERLAQAQAQSRKLEAMDEKYKKNPGELEKLTAALPKESDFTGLLISLEDLVSANNLVMRSVDFKAVVKKTGVAPPKINQESTDLIPQKNQGSRLQESGLSASDSAESEEAPSYRTTAITLNLEGGYDNFKNYLKAIEENKRLMDVTRLNYGAGSQETGAYSFGLELNVYYQ